MARCVFAYAASMVARGAYWRIEVVLAADALRAVSSVDAAPNGVQLPNLRTGPLLKVERKAVACCCLLAGAEPGFVDPTVAASERRGERGRAAELGTSVTAWGNARGARRFDRRSYYQLMAS
eukprot:6191694-Pleurochrysis_carterae.AAC.2